MLIVLMVDICIKSALQDVPSKYIQNKRDGRVVGFGRHWGAWEQAVQGAQPAGTHRAEIGVETAADVADGFHQLRHNFFQSLRIHTPPLFASRLF